MPVSQVTLPVSHLPQATSFILTALQPLGYRFLCQRDDQVGFGVDEPDFFLCQERPGVQAGTTDIAFDAPSRAAVDAFYVAALRAGGVSRKPPTLREASSASGHNQKRYAAAIYDIDGNSIEVECKSPEEEFSSRRALMPQGEAAATAITVPKAGGSVLSWQKNVAKSLSDRGSVISASQGPLKVEKTRSVVSAARPMSTEQRSKSSSSGDLFSAKALVGTLLGAAGGAAVAYAMMRAENEDEAEKERLALQAPPTHQIQMVDREVEARRSEVGQTKSQVAPPVSTVPDMGAALGTLISTFVPPSSAPRLMLEAAPSRSGSQAGGGTQVGGNSQVCGNTAVGRNSATSRSAPQPPRPHAQSVISTSSAAITAKEIPLPKSSGTSVVTARDVPLPLSSRSSSAPSVLTITPSESVSNAGSSRRSKAGSGRSTSGSSKHTSVVEKEHRSQAGGSTTSAKTARPPSSRKESSSGVSSAKILSLRTGSGSSTPVAAPKSVASYAPSPLGRGSATG